MNFKKVIHYSLITFAFAFFAWAQAPTEEKKEERGLEFNVTENPDGVWIEWSNASATQTHSVYRRLSGTDDVWELLNGNLTGVHGGTMYMGFTLDQTWDYEFRENVPE